MRKKEPAVKTKGLIIKPMSDKEINNFINETEDNELKELFKQKLAISENNQAERIMYVPWSIMLKNENTVVGYFYFLSAVKEYAVEIGINIFPKYQNNNYATQAIKAMSDWCFSTQEVYYIEAKINNNPSAQKVLEKCSFTLDDTNKNGQLYVLENTPTMYMPIFMSLGTSIGVLIGLSINKLIVGMCLGISIGLLLGIVVDDLNKKQRKKITERRNAVKEARKLDLD